MSSQHLRRAGIGGLSALVCASTALLLAGAPANAFPVANTGGTIGIVDTDTVAPGTQGATEVQAGSTAQALDDVVVTIPNDYKAGDRIVLSLFDRSASGASSTETNSDAAHLLQWSGTPTVSVTPTAGNPAGATNPTFTYNAEQSGNFVPAVSNRSHGNNDLAVFTVGADATSAGSGSFQVKVSGLKVDTGASIAPGEIRVVPFAWSEGATAVDTDDVASGIFGGNKDGAAPLIKTYTVPGYVQPVKFTAPAGGIVADGTNQTVGDLTIAETSPRGLQAGTYTVTVSSPAVVHNDDQAAATGNYVTVSLAGNPSTETLANTKAHVVGNTVSFTLSESDLAQSNGSKTTVTLHGLLLSSTVNSPITYTLSGGSVSAYYSTAGTSPAIAGAGLLADSAFGSAAMASQANIAAPSLAATGTSLVPGQRIGGSNRYATAAQVALKNKQLSFNDGKIVVLASGEAYPDSLSSGFLSQRIGLNEGQHGASVLLTKANSLPSATSSVLTQLGTTKVYIVGGTGAVSDAVQAQVQSLIGTGTIVRLGGQNRYDTNKIVNDAASNIGTAPIGKTTVTFGQASKATALLATGEDFADALAFGPATRGNGTGPIPLILTRTSALNQQATDQLSSFAIKQVVIGGGTGAVSGDIETNLGTMGIAVKRVSGANRYETATKVADFEIAPAAPSSTVEGGLGFDPGSGDDEAAGLATGQSYVDALAGGPLAADGGSPILLTTSDALQPLTLAWLTAHKATYDLVTAFGLQAAVSDAALNAAQAAIL